MTQLAAPSRLRSALDHGREGRGVSRDDALLLMETCELDALLETAGAIRDRSKGRTISYSRKVFIPLTHLCRDYCGYCTFRADPQPGHAAYMSKEEVLAAAEAGRRAGCKEALFSLGDQPERIFPEARDYLRRLGFDTTLEYLAAMSQLVLDETGETALRYGRSDAGRLFLVRPDGYISFRCKLREKEHLFAHLGQWLV